MACRDDASVWCKGLTPGDNTCGQEPARGYPDPEGIKKVYVVFSNHLDLGYTQNHYDTGSCAGAVVNQYFKNHIPNAMNTSNVFRSNPVKGRMGNLRAYKWMTQSWITSVYRNCPETKINVQGPAYPSQVTECPDADALAAFQTAVEANDIVWHAFPHNSEPETLNPTYFDIGLNLTFMEDDNAKHAHRMTLSQRDVPGMTRGVIPLLAKRGIKAVSVGMNGVCPPPNVPKAFVWRDPPSGESILALFHPHGYGRRRRRRRLEAANRRRRLASGDGTYPDANAGGEAEDVGDDDTTGGPSIVIRDGEAPVINRADDCATVPYSGTYICYAWNGDNSGPHTYEAANLIFDALEGEFTEAEVVASDAFDDFVADVQPFLSYLPIVEKEIVDSWIYGASADPIKVSRARAMYRARAACHEAGKCTEADEPNIRAFDRLMLKISEHTWGWWGGTVKDPIANNGSYSNEYLQEQIKVNKDYVSSIKTWEEQRNFIANAVASLGGTSDFAKAVAQELAEMEPTPFPTDGFTEATSLDEIFTIDGALQLGFDANGAISTLTSVGNPEAALANAAHTIGAVWYQGISNTTMLDFNSNYTASNHQNNYGKPNLDLPAVVSVASLTGLLVKKSASPSASTDGGETVEFLLDLSFDELAHNERGAPADATAHLVVTHSAFAAIARRRLAALPRDSLSALQRAELAAASTAASTTISYTLLLRNKTACHGPETMWWSSRPAVGNTTGEWVMDKLGSSIGVSETNLTGQDPTSPENDEGCDGFRVTCGGHMHAIGEGGISYGSTPSAPVITLASPDVALISVGPALPVPTPLVVPDMAQGVHFSLVNNIWNTNYPFVRRVKRVVVRRSVATEPHSAHPRVSLSPPLTITRTHTRAHAQRTRSGTRF